MRLSPLVSFFFLQLMLPSQVRSTSLRPALPVRCEVMDMMPNAFDDQYKRCEAKMENEAAILLKKERSYENFRIMWDLAEKAWEERKPFISNRLPPGFMDEYGTAVVLYTMEWPHAIYRELNNNVSIAGQSRDYYMRNFHFKALHFYLTRALQLLKPNCKYKYITYRGSWGSFEVSDQVRFGQFAFSSGSKSQAEVFGTETVFTITTCFGADINELSIFGKEFEILIPVYEKFKKVQQTENLVTLKSTGERCSYFNCAYFGGEKRKTPLCCADVREETEPGSILSPSNEILGKYTVQLQDSESKKAEICSSDGREETEPGSVLSPSYKIIEKPMVQLQDSERMKAETFSFDGREETQRYRAQSPSYKILKKSTVQFQDPESMNAKIYRSDGRKEAVPGIILSPSNKILENSTVQLQDPESINAEIFSSDGREETEPGSILSPSNEIRENSTVQLQDSESMKGKVYSSAPGGNLSTPWISMVFAGLVLLFFYSGKQFE